MSNEIKKLSKERQKMKDKNNIKRLMEATGADRKGILATISDEATIGEHVNIKLSYLKDYPEHTYTIYDDEELEALAENIKLIGLSQPLTVWHHNNEYIILCGHNRKRACELAGLDTVDCVVKHNISEAEAKLIVNTNLHQRGNADLSLYDKCMSILQTRNATRKLYEEDKERFKLEEGKTFDAIEETTRYYKMKYTQITLYLRLAESFKKDWFSLIPKVMNIKTAYALCQLQSKNLKKVMEYLCSKFKAEEKIKVSESLVKDIRKMEEENSDIDEIVAYIDKPKSKGKKDNKKFTIDFSSDEYEPLYDKIKNTDEEEIKSIVLSALNNYFSRK